MKFQSLSCENVENLFMTISLRVTLIAEVVPVRVSLWEEIEMFTLLLGIIISDGYLKL